MGSTAWQRERKLPEGLIQFCFEAFDYNTGRKLSLPGCGMALINTQKPPLLNLPFNGVTLTWQNPLNQLFQWTPHHSGLAHVEYELIVKQLWDEQMRPEAAWAFSTEILREPVRATSFLYGVMSPSLTPGMRYAWAVRAIAYDGLDEMRVFENNGLSEIRWFRVEDRCPHPIDLKVETDNGKIYFEWTPPIEQHEVTVSYRQTDPVPHNGEFEADWFHSTTTGNSIVLYDVRPEHTYEYRVATTCRPGFPVYGPARQITVPPIDTPNPNCGEFPEIDLSNRERLLALNSGDMFFAADFPVYAIEVKSDDNGVFNGTGYMVMSRFFNHMKIRVDLIDVVVNTDRRKIGGVVRSVYNPTKSSMADLDKVFEGGSSVGRVKSGMSSVDIELDFVIPQNAVLTLDAAHNTVIVSDISRNQVGVIDISGISASRGGGGIFPVTVQDSGGNIYKIDRDGDGKPVAALVGKEGVPIADGAVDYKKLDTVKAIITFEKSGKYAFDRWIPQYDNVLLINGKYEKLMGKYDVPFKLVPPGKTDIVQAVIDVKDKSVNPRQVVFKTPKGTEFAYEYDAANSRYTVSLTGGESGDGQEIYALYPGGYGYFNLGKLIVVSYPENTCNLTAVSVNGATMDVSALENKLNEIYKP
jgi:hypothetical protein